MPNTAGESNSYVSAHSLSAPDIPDYYRRGDREPVCQGGGNHTSPSA